MLVNKYNLIKENQTTNIITSTELSNIIVEAIQDKKGKRIVLLDLRAIDEATADYYIICQGNSPTQVSAIAENVVDEAYIQAEERPIGKEGLQVGEWALVDFFNVVVHIFVEPVREKFALEELWGDAKKQEYQDLN